MTQTKTATTEGRGEFEELEELFGTMVMIRACEERLVRSFQAGLVLGGCHTYIGEEAIAAGVSAGLTDEDYVFGTHRGHGHAIAKGMEPFELFAELYGRADGASRGRGGSMHLFKPEIGIMGTNGIVGPSILLASGAAYTFKLLKTDRVAVAYFGDGAVNNGAFHEGCNMAANWDLPVILVCENNLYATEVPFGTVTKETSVAKKAESYGLRAMVVDGNDVWDVRGKATEAIDRARAGGGPTLLDCRTYRQRAHSEGMRDTGYRTREEIDEWKRRDPIELARSKLSGIRPDSREALEALEAGIRSEIAAAHERALEGAPPEPATVFEHVVGLPGEVRHA